MGNVSLLTMLLSLATGQVATPLCAPDAAVDGGPEFHAKGASYPDDALTAKKLFEARLPPTDWIRLLGAPERILQTEGKTERSLHWVYGLHRRSKHCRSGAWVTSYFTEYRVIRATFHDEQPAACRLISRAYVTPEPLPDPFAAGSEAPWDRDVECLGAEF